jgi:cytochrome P450
MPETAYFDPRDPRFVTDPYPLYAELRERAPIHRNPLGFRVFMRHGDAQAILKDRRFSSDARSHVDLDLLSPEAVKGFQGREGVAEELGEMAPFLFRDPPDHTRLRGLVAKAFTPRGVESLRPRVEQIARSLIDRACKAGQVDLVDALAYPLPVQVISEMLGIPEEDRHLFREWSDVLARGLDPDFLLPEEFVDRRLASLMAFVVYFSGLIEERRRSPGDDLVSKLVQVEEQGDTLSHGELLSTLILLLVAGHETTVNLLSGGALALLQNPDQLALFRKDPSIERNAIEELLRFVSPVQWTGRVSTEEVELAGERIVPGEFVLMIIGSANRDPAVFDDPESLDLQRREVNHLGFGFGIHHCLGAPLARLEASVTLPMLFRSCEVELVDDRPHYKENIVLRGLAKLPVRIEGRRAA